MNELRMSQEINIVFLGLVLQPEEYRKTWMISDLTSFIYLMRIALYCITAEHQICFRRLQKNNGLLSQKVEKRNPSGQIYLCRLFEKKIMICYLFADPCSYKRSAFKGLLSEKKNNENKTAFWGFRTTSQSHTLMYHSKRIYSVARVMWNSQK